MADPPRNSPASQPRPSPAIDGGTSQDPRELDVCRVDLAPFPSKGFQRQTFEWRDTYFALGNREQLPALFHCTTGKDRTGWAAAALLTLLGVPVDTVMEDYLRGNETIIPKYQKAIDAARQKALRDLYLGQE